MNALEEKINAMATRDLRVIARKLANDHRDGADIALSRVLDSLMMRMNEDEFVTFCDSL